MPLLLLAAAALFLLTMKPKRNPAAPVTRAERLAFAERLRPIALEVERSGGTAPDGTPVAPGIKADLGIIQAGHESAWGLSELAAGAGQNLFGMTAEPGTYWRTKNFPFVERMTREFLKGQWVELRRPFRRYDSWRASYLDWARRMQRPDFAAARIQAEAGNLKGFAAALQQLGYATDPTYAAKLEGAARSIV